MAQEELKPHLTRARWACLIALKQSPALLRRPFLPREVKMLSRNNKTTYPATGPTMVALEKAGWVERTTWGTGPGMPFQSGGPINAWSITDAGREAIAACPDTFPGEPVYGRRAGHDD